jgi:membrane protein DedA with SNARE-associated domain
MLDYIVHFVERFSQWGYNLIFLVVMVECQALVGLFMPGESLVLVRGFLAAQGVFDLDLIILKCSSRIMAGRVSWQAISCIWVGRSRHSWPARRACLTCVFVFNALGCALWAATFALLGYFFGESWHVVEKWFGRASAIGIHWGWRYLVGLLLLFLGFIWLWRWRGKKR